MVGEDSREEFEGHGGGGMVSFVLSTPSCLKMSLCGLNMLIKGRSGKWAQLSPHNYFHPYELNS